MYRPLGCFRFVLALMVMAQHFLAQFAPAWLALAVEPYEPGTTAVYVFFIVSGFVIAEAIDRYYRDRPIAFAANRAIRILPVAALGIFAGSIAYVAANGQEEASLLSSFWRAVQLFAGNLAQLLPFVSKKAVEFEVLPVGWSLRAENLFYGVCIAAILAGALVQRRPALARASIWVAATVLAAGFFADAVLGKQSLLRFIPLFAFGALAYQLFYRAQPITRFGGLGRWTIIAFIVVMIGIEQVLQPLNHPEFGFARHRFAEVAIFLALCITMLVLAGAKASPHFKPVDVWLGNLSYPLYIIHCVVMILWQMIPMQNGMLSLLGATAMTISLSVMVEAWVDRPLSRRRDAVRGHTLVEAVAATGPVDAPVLARELRV